MYVCILYNYFKILIVLNIVIKVTPTSENTALAIPSIPTELNTKTNILTNIKSINQKVDTINISLEEQTKSEKSILDALDRIKEVEDCIEVCPYCGQSLKGGNHVFRTSN